MKLRLKWFALLAWTIIIFLFSAQTGEQSSESSGVVEQLLSIFSFIPHEIFGIELQLIIRKGAHFTEYFILYGLMFNVLIDYQPFKKALTLAILFVFLYACTDEFHQSFVPGRACTFMDVLIDTSGGLLAMIFIMLIHQISPFITKKA